MTFSVLALDRRTGAIGGAAATGNLAVGAWVLRAGAREGAVATQGLSASTLWGDEAMRRLADGEGAETIVDAVTGSDAGRDHRQLAVLDRTGGVAGWTGAENPDVKGHICGPNYVIAGNWLSNRDVLGAMETAIMELGGAECPPLGELLLSALDAGVRAGSDSRGTLSAAIQIVRTDQAPVDLRVDYDEAPVARLRTLYDLATSPPYADWSRCVPTLDEPHQC